MAACCGRSRSGDQGEEDPDMGKQRSAAVPDNEVSLRRVHDIIDRMSGQEGMEPRQEKKKGTEFPDDEVEDEPEVDPGVSEL
eukprot:3747058-Pyramimonas_sp.AAC.1